MLPIVSVAIYPDEPKNVETVHAMLDMIPARATAGGILVILCKICVADATLCWPFEFLFAIATTLNGESESANGTETIAVVPDTAAEAIVGYTITDEIVPTKFSLESLIHPPTVTGPFADMM